MSLNTISYNTHPAPHLRQITPAATDFPVAPRGLYFGESGTVSIVNQDGTATTDIPVVAGGHLHVQPLQVTAFSGTEIFGYFD